MHMYWKNKLVRGNCNYKHVFIYPLPWNTISRINII